MAEEERAFSRYSLNYVANLLFGNNKGKFNQCCEFYSCTKTRIVFIFVLYCIQNVLQKLTKLLEKMTHINQFKTLLILFFFAITSCVTQSKVEYLQGLEVQINEFLENDFQDYRLKPNDELYIQINSLDEGPANVFYNLTSQALGNSAVMTPFGASLISHTIDKNGLILLPLIGYINAKDKTLTQLSRVVKDSLQNVLNNPTVSIKLVNKYVTVLGEVRNPGHFVYSQERLTIFEALGLAGDISDYGNRNEIILVRNEDNKNILINLDINSSQILSSSNYYLRPNDLIYVKPLRNKFWGMRQFPFSVFFSVLTTGLLIYNVMR
jgi:polysaccharide export outer membrane protein